MRMQKYFRMPNHRITSYNVCYTKLLRNAFNIPVHLFVGDRDGLMSTADAWNKNFKENNVNVEYIIYPGIAHNSWEYAYADGFT